MSPTEDRPRPAPQKLKMQTPTTNGHTDNIDVRSLKTNNTVDSTMSETNDRKGRSPSPVNVCKPCCAENSAYRSKRMSSTTPAMNLNDIPENTPIIYRLVLTGGPCSGKTTGQARLSTFFENLGWKVYRVPETATTLFSGGIRFPDMTKEEGEKFQENLIKVMMATEKTFFQLAASSKKNCIIICDRGVMDATAYMTKECTERVFRENHWNTVDVRDNRYNSVVHLVTSADGAEEYYNMEGNPTRTEGLELARELDQKTCQAWVGHPYIDVIDNSTDFDTKMRRMISAICRRIGIDTEDRLQSSSKKLKFLVKAPIPSNDMFPSFQDFEVVHDYLRTSNPKTQSRLRKRGQGNIWSYQHTVRRSDAGDQLLELRRQISHRDYVSLLSQRDESHRTIYKVRRCFIWKQTYFQMDIYKKPCSEKCFGLIMLETYSSLTSEELKSKIPPFLQVVKDVSNDPAYSMYYLSKKSSKSLFEAQQKCSHHQEKPAQRYKDERLTMQKSVSKSGAHDDIEYNTYHMRIKGKGVSEDEMSNILTNIEKDYKLKNQMKNSSVFDSNLIQSSNVGPVPTTDKPSTQAIKQNNQKTPITTSPKHY